LVRGNEQNRQKALPHHTGAAITIHSASLKASAACQLDARNISKNVPRKSTFRGGRALGVESGANELSTSLTHRRSKFNNFKEDPQVKV